MDKLRKKRGNSYGITLVALVVTIVVLLILAGITITYVLGDNSIFKKASEAKLDTELAKIEESASLIHADKLLEKAKDNFNERPTMQEIVGELREEGYTIEQVEVSGDAITGISLNKESMILGFGMTNTIQVTLEGNNERYTYYAKVNGKYYKMNLNNGLITIDRTESEISDEEESTAYTLTVSSGDKTVATATVDNTTNVVTVTANSKAGTVGITVTYGSYTKTCSVTVKDIPVATKMELNSVRARIAAGYTRWLTAMTTPMNALQEFKWTSSDTSIATVNDKGIITAKKAGTAMITAKTTDGSNQEGTCEVTVVENAPDIASLKDYQTKNTIAKDVNGNLITVPGDFKVLTDLGTKVTDGIVIRDREENEFVWVPVDSVSTGTIKPADDIRLGRYTFDETNGTPAKKQDADNYSEVVTVKTYYQEKTSNDGNTAAKNLEDFVTKTKAAGGYYIARYEASNNGSNKPLSQANKIVWNNVTQPNAATYAQGMYNNNSHIESDLINSYSWDTAIIFIQKYSGNTNYANVKGTSINTSLAKTGANNDKVCNIHDMASNLYEWSTEHSTCLEYLSLSRGGYYDGLGYYASGRYHRKPSIEIYPITFRVILYVT